MAGKKSVFEPLCVVCVVCCVCCVCCVCVVFCVCCVCCVRCVLCVRCGVSQCDTACYVCERTVWSSVGGKSQSTCNMVDHVQGSHVRHVRFVIVGFSVKTWLEFRSKLEHYLTLVDERYVTLLLNAESQPVANLPTGTEEQAVTIRTLSHTLYALLATLTTGRSLRLVQRVPNRNGFEAWRQMAAENAPKTAGRRFAMLQAVLQPGTSDNPAKFEETWKSWEHQVHGS